jgi:hypothetical protein
MVEDEYGNVYFVASYSDSIAKVDPTGVVTPFFHPQQQP